MRRWAIGLALLSLYACARGGTEERAGGPGAVGAPAVGPAGPSAPPAGPLGPDDGEAAPAPRPLPMVGTDLDQDAILAALSGSPPVVFRPVGTTSLVFEMGLDGPVEGAFKAAARGDPRGFLGEIAAYRLARLVGLDNVPPAVGRRIPRETIHRLLRPSPRGRWAQVDAALQADPDGAVPGAAIYWVQGLRDLYLDRPSRMAKWSAHLVQRGWVPAREMDLYRDLSNMLAFDYLIGNWDRFSGGNVLGVPSGGRLVVRDHNLAFTALHPFERHDRLVRHLHRTERFSRSFVQGLLRLTPRSIRQALAEDPLAREEPILTDEQIRGVLDRRDALRSYIAALVDQHGEARVLFFD